MEIIALNGKEFQLLERFVTAQERMAAAALEKLATPVHQYGSEVPQFHVFAQTDEVGH